MNEQSDYSVVTPLAAGTILGGSAIASKHIDNFLTRHGLPSHLKFNPLAVRAIQDFARARATDMHDPNKFIYRYANLANRAAKSQLFLNDNRRTWEWFTNSPEVQSAISDPVKNLQWKVVDFRTKIIPTIQEHLEKVFGSKRARYIAEKLTRISQKIELPLHVMQTDFEPLKTRIQGLSAARVNKETRKLTHIAELAQSRSRALKRLLYEGASKEYIVGKGNVRKYLTEVANAIGSTGKWTVDPATGLLKTFDLPGPQKAVSVKEIKKIIEGNSRLAQVARGISTSYNGKNFGKLLNIFRFAHSIRNPKLRLLLSLGATGMATLGATNLWKNIEKNHGN